MSTLLSNLQDKIDILNGIDPRSWEQVTELRELRDLSTCFAILNRAIDKRPPDQQLEIKLAYQEYSLRVAAISNGYIHRVVKEEQQGAEEAKD